jgi:DNA-binding NtrC family response regulator
VHLEEKSVIIQEKKEDLGKTKKILLMDDEAEVRESLAELLLELGYEVIACENGEEAVKIYQEQGPFDLAILDYTVPGKWNGIEVLRELKKVDPVVKAILVTGYGQTETVILAKQEGFKEVLIKPFEAEELLRALKASLS